MYLTALLHEFNTINKLTLYKPRVNPYICQKCVYLASIKVFNKLIKFIADLVLDEKRYIASLRKNMIKKYFYTVEDFQNVCAFF